mmetsp:Transcript_45131/g.104349  ORF Transcript_45131/g.104349 Transcript_45131/m.104349 type:complete len:131 (-) Transcript_45131:121-513(-)
MPICRKPKRNRTLTDEEQARCKEITEAVHAKKDSIDVKDAIERAEAALLAVREIEAEQDEATLPTEDPDYVGVMLGSWVLKGSDLTELEVDTDECYVEEPRVVVEDEDDVEDERSLWGDGDKDPAEADED